MAILLCIAIAILFAAFILACHGYNRLYDARDRLEIQNENLTANNGKLVAMVTRLRYKHQDFEHSINERGSRCVSTGVADLIGPQR